MQYFAMTVEEKNELCKKGLKCLGCHRVFEDKIDTGILKWEFDLPDTVKEEPKDVPISTPGFIEKEKVNIQPSEEVKEPPRKPGRPKGSKKRGKSK